MPKIDMVFYTLTILICMMAIGAINYFISAPVFGFDLPYVVVAVVLSTIAVIVVDLIFAFIVRRLLPSKWFGVDKIRFHASKSERKFYEKIGIKRWKDSVLELGALSGFRKNKLAKPDDISYVERFIVEANYGIVIHLVGIIAGFSIIFLYPLRYWVCFGFPVALVNAFLNVLPIFILRYNLPKLHALYQFNKIRIERTATVRAE